MSFPLITTSFIHAQAAAANPTPHSRSDEPAQVAALAAMVRAHHMPAVSFIGSTTRPTVASRAAAAARSVSEHVPWHRTTSAPSGAT